MLTWAFPSKRFEVQAALVSLSFGFDDSCIITEIQSKTLASGLSWFESVVLHDG
jgi:hypothetical protein